MFSNSIVESINNECKDELSSYDVNQMIEVLDKLINIPVEEESLVGIQKKYSACINKLYEGGPIDEEFEIAAEVFFRIEPLLKKVLYLADKDVYMELKKNRKLECGPLLDELHVLEPLRTKEGFLDLSVKVEKLGNREIQLQVDHILRAYRLRNFTAHEMRSWNRLKMLSNIQDVMVSLLYICLKYKNKIVEAYDLNDISEQIDVDNYITPIVKKYEEEIKKGFVFVPINWENNLAISQSEAGETKTDINYFLSKSKGNSHILLLGEAGCGKSTSVDYLEYKNAKECTKDKTAAIPVKIKLIETNNKWISLEEAICDELGVSNEICLEMLNRGRINVYLDGVNELVSSRDIKINIVKQIEKFLIKYRNVFVLITDREHVEIKINAELNTYYLHQLGEEDIKKYVQSKEIEDEKKEELINYAVRMSTQGVRFTPIILNFLGEYVKKNSVFPEDSTELYVEYICFLIAREYNEKKDINAAPGRLDVLLKYLAVHMVDENSISTTSALREFAKCVNYLGMSNIDTKNCLDLSLQLGILEQDDDTIRFSNEEFYDSLFAKGLDIGMEDWNDD